MPSNSGRIAITEAAKKGLADTLKAYVQGGLNDFAFAAADLPAFLADTGSVVTAAQPTRQIVRAACRTYARGGGPQNLPGFEAVWSGICSPYLESIGEAVGTGSVGAPFAGGQCPGVLYVATARGNNNSGVEIEQLSGAIEGPVRRAVGSDTGVGDAQSIFILHGEGQASPLGITVSAANAATWRIVSVVAQDGSNASECGDPPVEFVPPPIPPGLPPLPPTTPVDIPGIGPVNIGLDFNPDGTINITAPNLGLEFGIGDVALGLGDSGGAGAGVGELGDPGAAVQSGSGDPVSGEGGSAEGEAPEGFVLTGLRVDVLSAPPSRVRYTAEADRGVAYVYMGTPEGLSLDPTGSILRSGQFFFAQADYLTKWQVRTRFGYNTLITPYYREIPDA